MRMRRVTVLPDGVAIPVGPGETVLQAMTRGGFRYPFACGRGRCAACKVQLVSGEVVYTQSVIQHVFSDEERAAGVCLGCRALPVADVAIRLPEGDAFSSSPRRRPTASGPA
jgi:ferredoxin